MSKPFVRLNNLDEAGYGECEWHVVLSALPTRQGWCELLRIGWTDRRSMLDTLAHAYSEAKALADALGLDLIEEHEERTPSNKEYLPGMGIQGARSLEEKGKR